MMFRPPTSEDGDLSDSDDAFMATDSSDPDYSPPRRQFGRLSSPDDHLSFGMAGVPSPPPISPPGSQSTLVSSSPPPPPEATTQKPEKVRRHSSRRLSEILDDVEVNEDAAEATPMEEEPTFPDERRDNIQESAHEPMKAVPEGNCLECEEVLAVVFCEQCTDSFCQLCFELQHRKGNRKSHTIQPILQGTRASQEVPTEMRDEEGMESESSGGEEDSLSSTKNKSRSICESVGAIMRAPTTLFSSSTPANLLPSSISLEDQHIGRASMLERAKYIPLRLSYEQRKRLRLLEAALKVSRYTDRLDNAAMKGKAKRTKMQLQEICGCLTGLIMASDYDVGQAVLSEKDFAKYEKFFKEIFELSRRYKIMNPEKMRGDYGKLMYMIQDAVSSDIQELLGFSIKQDIKTVYGALETCNGVGVLSDRRIEVATRCIAPEGKSRGQIQREIAAKEEARRQIVRAYTSRNLSAETIELCLWSIADNNYYLYYDRDPIDKMIRYLKDNFSPTQIEAGYSLAITEGQEGSRLSHSHERQYNFVLQSLTLWREVVHDMFRLWYLTDEDLLTEENPYHLTDTGQGLHRVQQSPRVSRAMHMILHDVQKQVGNWVGSSVIHLGDKNVPNALMFIDKYAQVSKILSPIVKTLEQIDRLWEDTGLKYYIEREFKSVDLARKEILADFFREAFDGSGADNFFDAGSCIDGRLTSAWNWCSHLPHKRFYTIFKLAGFIGFDGKFN